MNFVKRNNSKETNLYNLVSMKYNELLNPKTSEDKNYFIIMAYSLYFIKDNNFIQEEFLVKLKIQYIKFSINS